jgi:hypothetical protein
MISKDLLGYLASPRVDDLERSVQDSGQALLAKARFFICVLRKIAVTRTHVPGIRRGFAEITQDESSHSRSPAGTGTALFDQCAHFVHGHIFTRANFFKCCPYILLKPQTGTVAIDGNISTLKSTVHAPTSPFFSL